MEKMKVYIIDQKEVKEGKLIGKYHALRHGFDEYGNELDWDSEPTYQVELSDYNISESKVIYRTKTAAQKVLNAQLLQEETQEARRKLEEAEKALAWINDNKKTEQFSAEIKDLCDRIKKFSS